MYCPYTLQRKLIKHHQDIFKEINKASSSNDTEVLIFGDFNIDYLQDSLSTCNGYMTKSI